MHGKILQPKEEDDTPKLGREGKAPIPEEKKTRRGLFRSPSAPMGLRRCATMDGSFSPTSSPFIFATSGSAKKRRPAPDMHVKPKRHRSDDAADFDSCVSAPAWGRSYSSEAEIKSAVHKLSECPDLVGDSVNTHVLPTVCGPHGLKAITPSILANVLDGDYSDDIARCVIVDARFPYEFERGHIRDALNLYTPDDITNEFLAEDLTPAHSYGDGKPKRTVLIFHCEFSSERGPRL